MLLGRQPRVRLATLPTPLQEAPRLRAALGGDAVCPRIFIKRDDLTGLAFGGNKVRKLEYLLADALAQGATTVITAGAVQSNHARMTAAAARLVGLRPVLVLDTKVDEPPAQGNLLLDRLLGAEVRFVPDGTDMDRAIAAVGDELRDAGERPYLVTIGGSNAIGALGYVAFSLELQSQCVDADIAPTRLYYANGSRGTQAGLVLGAKAFSASWTAQGVAVSSGDAEKRVKAALIANEAAELIACGARVTDDDLLNDDGFIGAGYGALTAECREAISLLATTEAIFLDPVYSGKAMAGMIDQIRRGQIDPADTVVFLHTGGTPALFARADDLMNGALS